MDKFAAMRLEPMEAVGMRHAPAVRGLPGYLSCRVRQMLQLGSHDLFLGEVVGVQVRDDLMREDGSLHLEEAGLVTRCPDEEDRRQVRVFPTEKALVLLPEIRAGFREWREYLQEGLTEEELELFCGDMDKVTRRAAAWCGRMVTQGEEEP